MNESFAFGYAAYLALSLWHPRYQEETVSGPTTVSCYQPPQPREFFEPTRTTQLYPTESKDLGPIGAQGKRRSSNTTVPALSVGR